MFVVSWPFQSFHLVISPLMFVIKLVNIIDLGDLSELFFEDSRSRYSACNSGEEVCTLTPLH
jgi:hypothetical protein